MNKSIISSSLNRLFFQALKPERLFIIEMGKSFHDSGYLCNNLIKIISLISGTDGKNMADTTILGVLLRKRMQTAESFQEILSKHGCSIKTRIGIHNASGNVCSPDGVILLDVVGSDADIQALENDLKAIDGAEVQKMSFVF